MGFSVIVLEDDDGWIGRGMEYHSEFVFLELYGRPLVWYVRGLGRGKGFSDFMFDEDLL